MTFSVVKLPSGDQLLSDAEAHELLIIEPIIPSESDADELKNILNLLISLVPQHERPRFFAHLGQSQTEKYFKLLSGEAKGAVQVNWDTLESMRVDEE